MRKLPKKKEVIILEKISESGGFGTNNFIAVPNNSEINQSHLYEVIQKRAPHLNDECIKMLMKDSSYISSLRILKCI